MRNAEPFAYRQIFDNFSGINFFPYLPLTLSDGNNSIETSGLLDTGASVNVMPYQIGLQLNAINLRIFGIQDLSWTGAHPR